MKTLRILIEVEAQVPVSFDEDAFEVEHENPEDDLVFPLFEAVSNALTSMIPGLGDVSISIDARNE